MKAAVVLFFALMCLDSAYSKEGSTRYRNEGSTSYRKREGEDYFLPGLDGAFDLFGNIAAKAIAKFAYDACFNPGSGSLEDKAKNSR